jgi:TolB-like protein/Flp pilus assembly protein TadD
LRYQTATDLKTDLARLKRDLESGRKRAAESSESRSVKPSEKSVAVLYFENVSGAKEDEYFRDGVTEDIITELSKIRDLRVFSRPTVLAYRDKQVTPTQIGAQLGAAFVLAGSIRRAGNRLRISGQLIDTNTDFPVWSERYDRELKDVFEVQDEIALKIAEALRVTLTPQEERALASKPTDNLQAYDLYLRGKAYARRLTLQDIDFALQMFENAVALDPKFALAYAAIANGCAIIYTNFGREQMWLDRANNALQRALLLRPELLEVQLGRAWILYSTQEHDEAIRIAREVVERKRDTEGAYYLLCRALFAAGRYQDVAAITESALEVIGEDYNAYVPIVNSLVALGKDEQARNVTLRRIVALESHLKRVPEDARARTLLAVSYAKVGRDEDAAKEATFATVLRPNDAMILYNAACVFGVLGKKPDALDTIRKAYTAGFTDAVWARRDPDLAILRGDPEFERLYPESKATATK